MKNYFNYLFIALLMLVSACAKDENNDLSGSNSTITTSIIGRIFDESGIALPGADVFIGNKSATSNPWGIYIIEDVVVPKDRSLITVKKAGYWDQVGSFKPKSGSVSYSDLCLYSSANTHTVDALLGGTITTSEGASIQFPADAFEKLDGTAYTGTVSLTVHHLSRNANLFSLKAPGTDFKGKSLSNTIENLVSYGMIGATLKDGIGNELKLKSGKKAIIILPVHATQLAVAPPSIPLWHFNDATAIWEEEGTAIFNGIMYTGEVSHFSWWNCDDPGGCPINGKVLDCNNQPRAYCQIVIEPNLMGPITNGYGDWSGIISFGQSQILHAEYIDNASSQSYSSLSHTVPSLSPNTPYVVPNLVFSNLNCYNVSGTINNCLGQPSLATVLVIHNNNLLGYQYTSNGQFNINVGNVGNVPLQILAYKGLYSTALNTNFGTGLNLNLGTLSLCDTVNLNNNVIMTFSSATIGNIPFSLDVSSSSVNFISGKYEMTMAYTDSASGDSSTFIITTPLYANGLYNWNNTNTGIGGSVFYQGVLYNILQNPPGGSTTYTNTPAPGGNLRGTFNGPVLLSGGILSLPGTMTANFDVYRNN
jgi:hypothetical protein